MKKQAVDYFLNDFWQVLLVVILIDRPTLPTFSETAAPILIAGIVDLHAFRLFSGMLSRGRTTKPWFKGGPARQIYSIALFRPLISQALKRLLKPLQYDVCERQEVNESDVTAAICAF